MSNLSGVGRASFRGKLVIGLLVVLTLVTIIPVHAKSVFNQPGNLLVTDQFNNRVVELDPLSGDIIWSYGTGNSTNCNPGPGAIIGPNDAERLANGLTVIAGTGIPANTVAGLANGCVDNRVIVVDQSGSIVWQYGQAGVTGTGPNELSVPVFAIQLPNQDFLIVDQGNNRVIEVNNAKNIVWSYGPNSTSPLNNPNSAELLTNGNVLIADENNNRTIEVNRAGQMVWQYNQGLAFAAFASRLPNGDTLITDSGHARVIEVTVNKQIVWQYSTNTSPGSNSNPLPTNAVRLANGNTIISDQFNDRVLILDQNKNIVHQYGMTNSPGSGPNELNAPYTAYVIGDYTGQTPPPSGGVPVPEFNEGIVVLCATLAASAFLAKRRRIKNSET